MKYHVHIFAVVRARILPNIEAGCQEDAVRVAATLAPPEFRRLFDRDITASPIDQTEYGEENSHYLVDEVGDEVYLNSEWYVDEYAEKRLEPPVKVVKGVY